MPGLANRRVRSHQAGSSDYSCPSVRFRNRQIIPYVPANLWPALGEGRTHGGDKTIGHAGHRANDPILWGGLPRRSLSLFVAGGFCAPTPLRTCLSPDGCGDLVLMSELRNCPNWRTYLAHYLRQDPITFAGDRLGNYSRSRQGRYGIQRIVGACVTGRFGARTHSTHISRVYWRPPPRRWVWDSAVMVFLAKIHDLIGVRYAAGQELHCVDPAALIHRIVEEPVCIEPQCCAALWCLDATQDWRGVRIWIACPPEASGAKAIR